MGFPFAQGIVQRAQHGALWERTKNRSYPENALSDFQKQQRKESPFSSKSVASLSAGKVSPPPKEVTPGSFPTSGACKMPPLVPVVEAAPQSILSCPG